MNKILETHSLTSKDVYGLALPFQAIYNIHGCYSFSPNMLYVCNGVPNRIPKKHFNKPLVYPYMRFLICLAPLLLARCLMEGFVIP